MKTNITRNFIDKTLYFGESKSFDSIAAKCPSCGIRHPMHKIHYLAEGSRCPFCYLEVELGQASRTLKSMYEAADALDTEDLNDTLLESIEKLEKLVRRASAIANVKERHAKTRGGWDLMLHELGLKTHTIRMLLRRTAKEMEGKFLREWSGIIQNWLEDELQSLEKMNGGSDWV